MIAKDKLKRFVETRRKDEKKALEVAEAKGGKDGKANIRVTQAVRLHKAQDEYPHRFMAPDYFRGQLGLKDLAYPPIDDDYQSPLHRFSCGSVSTHGQNHGKYKVNQDRGLTAYPFKHARDKAGTESALFVVADGHGKDGHYVADYVVKRVLDELSKALESDNEPDRIQCIVDAYAKADSELADFDALGLDRQSSGTTCVAALLIGDDLYVASTGDAKIVMGQVKEGEPDVDLEDNAKNEPLPGEEDGSPREAEGKKNAPGRRRSTATEVAQKCDLQAIQLTVEHKITDATEIQRIEEAGGVVEPAPGYACDRIWFDESFSGPGLQPTRTLGDHAASKIGVIADPDCSHHKLQKSDKFLILATDGVWEYVSNRQAVRFVEAALRLNVNEPARAELAAKYLVNIATKYWINEGGGYQDDISATVVVLDPPVWKKKYE